MYTPREKRSLVSIPGPRPVLGLYQIQGNAAIVTKWDSMVVHDTNPGVPNRVPSSNQSTNNLPFHRSPIANLIAIHTLILYRRSQHAGRLRAININGAFHFVIGSTEISSAASSFIWAEGPASTHILYIPPPRTHSTAAPTTVSDHRSSNERRKNKVIFFLSLEDSEFGTRRKRK